MGTSHCKFQIFDTASIFTGVCEANNGFFASFSNGKCICFINNEDTIKRKIEKLDGKEFKPLGITANKVDRLNNRVIATNFSLEFLKSIEIQNPFDVYFDGYLYICSLKQIIRFNEDFSNVVIFDMDLCPWQIRSQNNSAIFQ